MKPKYSPIQIGKHFLPGTTDESMRDMRLEEAYVKGSEGLPAYVMRKESKQVR